MIGMIDFHMIDFLLDHNEKYFFQHKSQAQQGPPQISKMESFVTMINGFQRFINNL